VTLLLWSGEVPEIGWSCAGMIEGGLCHNEPTAPGGGLVTFQRDVAGRITCEARPRTVRRNLPVAILPLWEFDKGLCASNPLTFP